MVCKCRQISLSIGRGHIRSLCVLLCAAQYCRSIASCARGDSETAAQNDVDAIRAWLARFVDTKATFDTYRKESQRLLLWSTTELR